MTTNYYIPPACIVGDKVEIPPDEVHHAVRVLRKKPGDEITGVDGEGGWYRIRLEHVEQGHAYGRVLESERNVGEPSYELTLAVGLQKQSARLELVLEKGVELGVTRFVPLLSERSERDRLKPDRARRIMVAAMKQCGRSRLPVLEEPASFEHWMLLDPEAHRFVCHERGEGRAALAAAVPARPEAPIHVAVGPEGGFSEDELRRAVSYGWTPVALGPRRLRTETAALTVAAVLLMAYDGAPDPLSSESHNRT